MKPLINHFLLSQKLFHTHFLVKSNNCVALIAKIKACVIINKLQWSLKTKSKQKISTQSLLELGRWDKFGSIM